MEVEIAKLVAKRRYECARSNNVTNAKKGPQSNEETDQDGFGAELAFGSIFNAFPDFTIFVRSALKGEDNKGDFNINGWVIDVKQTRHLKGRLIVAPWKVEGICEIDYFALMVGQIPTFTFMGFFAAHDIYVPDRLKDLGWGPVYKAEQDELYQLDFRECPCPRDNQEPVSRV